MLKLPLRPAFIRKDHATYSLHLSQSALNLTNQNPLDAGELGGTVFGYIPDAFSNDLPELPSESANRAKSRELSAARERDRDSAGGSEGTNTGSSRSSSPAMTE